MARKIRHQSPWGLAITTGTAFALLTSGFIALVQPATASGFTLTIVESGGSTSGWTHSGGVLQATSSVSINSSDIVSRLATSDLVVSAGTLVINSSVDASGALATSDLTFRSLGNINVAGGASIITNGGEITFQSDSDDSGVGSIRFGNHGDTNTGLNANSGTIESNGGQILISGGSNPSIGFAMSSTDISSFGGVNKPAAGIAAYGFVFDAGGGNVILRGKSSSTQPAASTRSVNIESNGTRRTEIRTSGTGAVTILGDATVNTFNAWGVNTNGLNVYTISGAITVSGKGGSNSANSRGLALVNSTLSSSAGNLVIEDNTPGSTVNFNGIYMDGTNSITSAGTLLIRADEIQSLGSLTLQSPSATIQPFSGVSFTAPLTLGNLSASTTQRLSIGLEGNTSDVTIDQPLSVGGDTQIFGGKVIVDGALNSAGDIVIATSSGDIEVKDPISSTKATGDTIRIFANKPAPVGNEAASTAGNVKLSGTGGFTVESGARALIYSGEATASTGLVTEVGGAENTRGFVGATSVLANISPALTDTGKFALFRSVTGETPPTITAASAPGVPTATTGVGVGVVNLEWTPSTGTPEISYRVESSPPGANCVVTGVTAVCSGLDLGVAYTFTVIATNEGGSTSSSTSESITLVAATAPSAPGTPGATPGDGTVDIAWTAPTSGTAPFTYALTSIPSLPAGASCTISGTSASCTGLTNGTQYSFIVSASNAAGSEDSVTSAAVRPLAAARSFSSGSSSPQPALNYFVVEGFKKSEARLTNAMRGFIRQEVSGRAGASKVVCIGTVRGQNWTVRREAIALARATVGCDYAKSLLPSVETELKTRLISKKKQDSLTVRIRVF